MNEIAAPVLTGSSSKTVFFIKSSGGGIRLSAPEYVIFCCYIANLNYSAIFVLLSLYPANGLGLSFSSSTSASFYSPSSPELSSSTCSSGSDLMLGGLGPWLDLLLSLASEVRFEFFFDVNCA